MPLKHKSEKNMKIKHICHAQNHSTKTITKWYEYNGNNQQKYRYISVCKTIFDRKITLTVSAFDKFHKNNSKDVDAIQANKTHK